MIEGVFRAGIGSALLKEEPMNRIAVLSRLLCLCLFSSLFILPACLPSIAAAATYGGGSGTEKDPFLIQDANQFILIGQTPGDWGSHFKLVSDIDLSEHDPTTLQPIGRWVSLGNNANQPFTGSFDGTGKTVRGFQYKDMQSPYVGLFRYVTGEIRDLHLVAPGIVADAMGAGALVGYLGGGGVYNCSVTDARVSGNGEVGALIGLVDGRVRACWSTGRVAGVWSVGGLIGRIGSGTVERSYSTAVVTGDDSVGGLVGSVSNLMSIMDSCYARGSVVGRIYVGGLIGALNAGRIYSCYSVGKISGKEFVGGLVGTRRVNGEVVGSFWDTQTSGQTTSAGGTGKTTAEMKKADIYFSMSWDFYVVWSLCEGLTYPIFQWQIPPGDLRCPDGVDFTDFAWFAAQWRNNACGQGNWFCDGADLDKSGGVNPQDLAVFAANWLAGLEWHWINP